MTGRALDAETAEEWGLGNRVTEEGDALDAAVEMGEQIASFPQETVRTDRAAVYDGLSEPLDQGLKIEAWHGSRALDTAREGADRFAGGEGRSGEGIEERES
nr:hypothetical protein [Halorientalis brevis]